MLRSKEVRNLEGPGSVAKTVDLTVEVDERIKKRLKLYSVATGEAMKNIVGRLLNESLPPLPRQSEATA
jgi:hypothetical protein